MGKSIGFDVDHKHTLACVAQSDQPDRYSKLQTEVDQLWERLQAHRRAGSRLDLAPIPYAISCGMACVR